jgi:excisionase family DNA binding protein
MPSGPDPGAVDRKSTALLTYQDVADYTQASYWTVRDWVDVGKLPVIRLPGRLVRIRAEDLERFLEAHRG